jgi:polyisoprenyl-teichoic acid--peptidoglycan teichoic acid transferase
LYRREDQYRSAQQQMWSAQRGRQRTALRRKRYLALLTVLVGIMVGVAVQTGVSLPSFMPSNESFARGGSPDGTPKEPGPAAGKPPAEGTVLSAESDSSQLQPENTTGGAGGGVAGDGDGAESQEERNPDKPETPPEESSEKPEAPPPASGEPLNVLVLGVDRRPSEGEGASSRSDTIMLAQVSPGSGRVELLSVPRDLYVEVEPGVEDRINTAYAYGGVEQAKAVMEGLTGVPIDAHAIIDFQGFEDVIDAMGGVEVDVADEVPPKYEIQDGFQTLDGEQALFFARYRGTAGGDLDRIKRQQQLLAALRAKMLRWNTVTTLPSMLRIANENVDTDLGLFQAISLGRALVLRGGEGDLTAVQLKGYPETLPDGAQVLLPDWEANEEILQDFRE